MGRNRAKVTGRAESGYYFQIPEYVLNSEQFRRLSYMAKALLLDIGAQFRGRNNGDLNATYSTMQKRNWKSKDSLAKTLRELLGARLLIKTRQGGRNQCCLYALGWRGIDDCGGKLDLALTTKVPLFAPIKNQSPTPATVPTRPT
jgi:hypothetical protein